MNAESNHDRTLPAVPAALLPVAWQIASVGFSAVEEAGPVTLALGDVRKALAVEYAALVRSTGAKGLTALYEAGPRGTLPADWLAEVLDGEQPAARQAWIAAPLAHHAAGGELLVVRAGSAGAPALADVAALAATLGAALAAIRDRAAQRRKNERLSTILEIAAQWNQAHEVEPLLNEMAEAATRLLRSDRASIFLWDRSNHLLVARPALGVEGGELRIPDNEGIVGQVIQTAAPRRVDAEHEQHTISRNVDKQLGYTTRTLLCVPLRSRRGEMLGAFEVINRLEGNFTTEDEAALVELANHAAIALENTQERKKLLDSRRELSEQAARGAKLIGVSPAIEELRQTIRRVAPTELAVLVLGENGTGKEVVSQAIHYLSPRRDQPLIAVNCAAITESLLESELFGHERGAFTDAHESHAGKFELASGGTLFLDEIGDLSLGGQAKLLRVLEEKVVVRVGGSKSIPTDTRVVAATNQDLAEMVRQKRFRQDLLFRLNVVALRLPPLRERAVDIIPLAEHFLAQFCRQARRPVPEFTPAARARLESHRWPGNVRELRNAMERLAYLSADDKVDLDDLSFMFASEAPAASATIPQNLPLGEATERFQVEYVEQAIRQANGHISAAAEQLGLHRSNLYRKMRQLGMNTDEPPQ
ncbi:MAG: sigma-54-dependent Fis family transcriptional regulator [Planctomycetes bacterium]|nr:sigma-54-dependent Fis family transcriptional regulator [Planctomycetota bacterium]